MSHQRLGAAAQFWRTLGWLKRLTRARDVAIAVLKSRRGANFTLPPRQEVNDHVRSEFKTGRQSCGFNVAQVDVPAIIDLLIDRDVPVIDGLAQINLPLVVQADLPHVPIVIGRIKDRDLAEDLYGEDRLFVKVQAWWHFLDIGEISVRKDRMIRRKRFEILVHVRDDAPHFPPEGDVKSRAQSGQRAVSPDAPSHAHILLKVLHFFVGKFEVACSGEKNKGRLDGKNLVAVEVDRLHVLVIGLDFVFRPRAHEIEKVGQAAGFDFAIDDPHCRVPVAAAVLTDVSGKLKLPRAGACPSSVPLAPTARKGLDLRGDRSAHSIGADA